jgi:predicted transcriptional regulator
MYLQIRNFIRNNVSTFIKNEDSTLKQAVNFRLDEAVLTTIAMLAKDLHTTKTDIIEKAVVQFALSKQNNRNSLMQFAGSMAASEADSILDVIRTDKNNKLFLSPTWI